MKLQNKKRIYLYVGIGLLLLCLIMVPIGTTLAKYVATLTPEQPYVPTGFYFTSDLLTEEGASYTLQQDVTSITVTLKNYADSARISGVDFAYTVTITKTSGTAHTETKNGSFTANTKANQAVTFSDLAVGHYTITATTALPYVETLTADFTIPTESATLKSSYEDAGPVVYLTITSEAYNNTVTITVPDGLIPDNTDYVRFGAEATVSSTTVSFPMTKYSEITLTFFKEDPDAPFAGSFTIEKHN